MLRASCSVWEGCRHSRSDPQVQGLDKEYSGLGSVGKVLRCRSGKAKRAEEAECSGVHEHSEAVFNAAWASIKAFRTEPSLGQSAERLRVG